MIVCALFRTNRKFLILCWGVLQGELAAMLTAMDAFLITAAALVCISMTFDMLR